MTDRKLQPAVHDDDIKIFQKQEGSGRFILYTWQSAHVLETLRRDNRVSSKPIAVKEHVKIAKERYLYPLASYRAKFDEVPTFFGSLQSTLPWNLREDETLLKIQVQEDTVIFTNYCVWVKLLEVTAALLRAQNLYEFDFITGQKLNDLSKEANRLCTKLEDLECNEFCSGQTHIQAHIQTIEKIHLLAP